jgi:hypothetical protein
MGFAKDCEKINEAQLLGWQVYRFTPGMIRSGVAMQVIERAICQHTKPS